MMLQALHKLAVRRNLREDPDFTGRKLHFVVVIDAEGTFRGLVPLLDERGNPLVRPGPIEPTRTVGVVAGFFLDKASYSLGFMRAGAKPERVRQCQRAFGVEVEAVVTATNDPGALAVQRFLARLDEQRAAVLAAAPARAAKKAGQPATPWEWTGDEYITFSLQSDDGLPVYERAAVADHWRSIRARQAGEDAGETAATTETNAEGRCIVTGQWGRLTALHAPLQRVPGAQARSRLVSYNASAFESYGLDATEMAPTSRDGSESYAAALNWLLAEASGRRFRAGVPLADDTVCVFWTDGESSLADDLAAWFAPTEEDAVRLAESPWRGVAPAETDMPFYALTIAGNSARVVVRDWYQSTADRIRANVRRWFDDLDLVGATRPPAIRGLLEALQATPGASKDKHGASGPLAARLFRAAAMGTLFPAELLGMAVRRMRVPPDEHGRERFRAHARAALIKTALLRLQRERPARNLEVNVSLNEDDDRTAYLLGRLFATLEKLQQVAVNPNATLRDRFYGAASSTPAVVFPRLLRLSMHHAAKVSGPWPEMVKAKIMAKVTEFPRVMTLEEQGLFAIGYYHQQQAFFAKRAKDDPAAPTPTEEEPS